ncbi:hypothetical protein JAAARDRAFT_322096 [Jaapia argillacea MUCL 33604]|uniref:Uncharacterized protein n=1 Tax=Jaapia argillacea MUCL 33604 TaxID=933084 RepID=A0A067PMW7_9AGAM|nr:hypothetical protein JAAARDRAFT_322096 [Jaapia argillacea MUCL 33604]
MLSISRWYYPILPNDEKRSFLHETRDHSLTKFVPPHIFRRLSRIVSFRPEFKRAGHELIGVGGSYQRRLGMRIILYP